MIEKCGPALSYYGSKYRSARRYPPPAHPLVIEPFAGGAGYALKHFTKKVILVEKDPRVAGIWRYLIRSGPREILDLPLMPLDASVDDLPSCDPWGKELIRAWLQGGARNGKNSFSTMAKNNLRENPHTPSFWGEACRARLARTSELIKHWEIVECGYEDLTGLPEATWFVDPPYNNAAGRVYRHHRLDYTHLGAWCRGLPGQAIVCENEGATWLDFVPLYSTANNWTEGKTKRSVEVVWTK